MAGAIIIFILAVVQAQNKMPLQESFILNRVLMERKTFAFLTEYTLRLVVIQMAALLSLVMLHGKFLIWMGIRLCLVGQLEMIVAV